MQPDTTTARAELDRLWARGTAFLGCPVALMGGAMSWVSERHLVAAISNAGGFGVIACGSMNPQQLAAEIAGSYRRRRETVGDLDIVVAAEPAGPAISAFTSYDGVAEVVEQGTTRATVLLRGGLQVDLRVVPPASHGAALCYFTGSKAHNIALRRIAIGQGLKLNEYGMFRGEAQIAGATEDDIYARLGLHAAPPPELREDTGEIDAARAGRLPDLVQLDDIRGDLHVHTEASDGQASLRAMAEAAKALGRDYVAITDHSRHLTVANGLDAARLSRQIDEIARLNATLSGIVVLASSEVDILEDGSLDLPDDILRRLDLVVGAVHSAFDLSREKQTERLLRAMDNPCLDIVAHPTGRLIDSRPPCAIDLERVLRGARQRGCHLEANAQPARLDLDGAGCRMAKEIGVRIAISTDAHAPGQLGLMRFGVDQARRGWLEKDDVLNTRTRAGLRRLLGRR